MTPEKIDLSDFVENRLRKLQTCFSHRKVAVQTRLDPSPAIFMPIEPLRKTFDGLVRNAIENTPDQGKIEIEDVRPTFGSIYHDGYSYIAWKPLI